MSKRNTVTAFAVTGALAIGGGAYFLLNNDEVTNASSEHLVTEDLARNGNGAVTDAFGEANIDETIATILPGQFNPDYLLTFDTIPAMRNGVEFTISAEGYCERFIDDYDTLEGYQEACGERIVSTLQDKAMCERFFLAAEPIRDPVLRARPIQSIDKTVTDDMLATSQWLEDKIGRSNDFATHVIIDVSDHDAAAFNYVRGELPPEDLCPQG